MVLRFHTMSAFRHSQHCNDKIAEDLVCARMARLECGASLIFRVQPQGEAFYRYELMAGVIQVTVAVETSANLATSDAGGPPEPKRQPPFVAREWERTVMRGAESNPPRAFAITSRFSVRTHLDVRCQWCR